MSEAAGALAPPAWLGVVVLVCVPATCAAGWIALARWARSEGLPDPDGRAMPAVRVPSAFGLVLYAFCFVLTYAIVMIANGLAARGLLPWEESGASLASPTMLLAQGVPAAVGLAVVAMLGRGAAASIGVRLGRPLRGTGLGLGVFAAALPVCVATLIVAGLVLRAMGIPPKEHPLLEELARTPTTPALMLAIVQAGVLAPLAEEFLYRGLLMTALYRYMRPAGAMAASSLVFAAAHALLEPQAVVPLFILGLALAYAAYRTRSLLAPVVGHAAFNTLMVVGMYYGGA